jgi:hypothetical protein
MGNLFNPGCCDCAGTSTSPPPPPPPAPCTGSITIVCNQACNYATSGVNEGIPGATVTLTNTATLVTYTGTTGADGSVTIGMLPIGTYNVSAQVGANTPMTTTGLVIIDPCTAVPSHVFTFPQFVLAIYVISCCTGLPGASVSVKQSGTAIASGTTDSTGAAIMTMTRMSNGTAYTITTTASPYYSPAMVTSLSGVRCVDEITLGSFGTSFNGTVTTNASLVSPFVCCSGPCRATPHGGSVTLSIHGSIVGLSSTFPAWDGSTYSGTATIGGTVYTFSYRCNSGFGVLIFGTFTGPDALNATSGNSDPLISSGTVPSGPLAGPWTVTEP